MVYLSTNQDEENATQNKLVGLYSNDKSNHFETS